MLALHFGAKRTELEHNAKRRMLSLAYLSSTSAQQGGEMAATSCANFVCRPLAHAPDHANFEAQQSTSPLARLQQHLGHPLNNDKNCKMLSGYES
mmetsp:Transcript_29689/g.50538  ORF Transcript_29689/g.50538 Transcript_29689/m.50538 type:complete len:95 (+) Transcript_29689:365-649(+)